MSDFNPLISSLWPVHIIIWAIAIGVGAIVGSVLAHQIESTVGGLLIVVGVALTAAFGFVEAIDFASLMHFAVTYEGYNASDAVTLAYLNGGAGWLDNPVVSIQSAVIATLLMLLSSVVIFLINRRDA